MRFVILFDMFLNHGFKIRTRFGNIARTAASKTKFTFQERFDSLLVRDRILQVMS